MSRDTPSRAVALDLYGVLFVGLKLAGVIDWSWIWVMMPAGVMFAIRVSWRREKGS